MKTSEKRTIEQIIALRPSLTALLHVADVTSSNDQLWEFWIGHVGVEAVVKACEAAIKAATDLAIEAGTDPTRVDHALKVTVEAAKIYLLQAKYPVETQQEAPAVSPAVVTEGLV